MKDLGQYIFILEGRSITDFVNSTEGNLDDLTLVLHSVKQNDRGMSIICRHSISTPGCCRCACRS